MGSSTQLIALERSVTSSGVTASISARKAEKATAETSAGTKERPLYRR